MKVYFVDTPVFTIPILELSPTGELEHNYIVCRCKDVQYSMSPVHVVHAMDRFLIDIRNNENAQELYIHKFFEIVNPPSPTNFHTEPYLVISYYAHDKITKK